MTRLSLTQHTVRCPLHDCTAGLQVRTYPNAAPSRRYRDVVACSLVPATPSTGWSRRGYFSDVAPPVSYVDAGDWSPGHPGELACSKPCLGILNAAEPGALGDLRCGSGVSDGLELARQTQSPGMMRTVWLHSI